MDETLLELDDYILNDTRHTSDISSLSICNTRTNRCLMDDFEMFTSDFDQDVPLLCSTPLPSKEHELGELRLLNQSVTDNKKLQDLIHSETIKILEVYQSLSSSSLDTVSLTKPNVEKDIPELALSLIHISEPTRPY